MLANVSKHRPNIFSFNVAQKIVKTILDEDLPVCVRPSSAWLSEFIVITRNIEGLKVILRIK